MANNDVTAEIRAVESPEELRAVQRFKYDVYVAEMGRYGSIADHDNRLLIEPDDAKSHVFHAHVDGKLAATMRLTWGGDGPLTNRHISQYDLRPFLGSVAPEQILIGERFMVAQEFRGTSLLNKIFATYMRFVNERRVQLVFGDCEPHLLNTYQAMGFRTYTEHHVNSPETGYLIPLVIVVEDLDYMRRIGSPFAKVLCDFAEDARVPANIDELLEGGTVVQSHRMLDPTEYLGQIKAAASEADALSSGLFRGMDEDEIAHCLEKSVLITCRRGDRVIKRGNVAKNMNMVLSGRFEVRDGDAVLAELGPGEVFGEISFFLKLPRTRDVIAAAEGTRMISFNDRAIRQMIDSHSVTAATLLYNVSIMLCERLRRTSERL